MTPLVTGLPTVLSVIGGLVALVTIAGGLWAVFKSAADAATIKRLREDNAEYVKRIEYIEPRWKAADEQNALLRELQNPTAQLGRLEGNQARMLELLQSQHETLSEIGREMHRKGPRNGPTSD